MTFFNYTSASGGQFSQRYRLEQRISALFDNPQGASSTTVSGGQEAIGVYEEIPDPGAPDAYYSRGDELLTFEGTEYQASGKVRQDLQWTSLSAEDIRARKDSEGQEYARRVAFGNAQTNSNPNVYVRTDDLNLFFYNVVAAFYSDRHKDRTLGANSANGYTPGTDPDPTTYWARDVPVYLINSNNGNELEIDASETDWGQVLKEIGTHLLDTRVALRNYRTDVGAAYDAYVLDPSETNRTALITLDPENPAYGWPPFYDGPTSGGFRVI